MDDDSLLNLRRLLPYLESVRCHPHVLLGGIHWSGFVPRAHWSGVLGDRCGWGWNQYSALIDFAKPVKKQVGACDELGGILPFPFATGAGDVMSSSLMRWVGTSAEVAAWVAEASGPNRQAPPAPTHITRLGMSACSADLGVISA